MLPGAMSVNILVETGQLAGVGVTKFQKPCLCY